jgi:hypothetical protein
MPHGPPDRAADLDGTKWFIEGDIKGCFDNIDHQVLLSLLRERIHDNRFVRLIENLLRAGYLEEWRYNPTLSGTPQGGVLSRAFQHLPGQARQFVEGRAAPAQPRRKEKARPGLQTAGCALPLPPDHRKEAQAKAERKQLKAMPAMVRMIPTTGVALRALRR